jgi:predicted ATPase
VKHARDISHISTLMHALFWASATGVFCGRHDAANSQLNELVPLADEKGGMFWKAGGLVRQGYLLLVEGDAAHAVQVMTSGLNAWRSTGASLWAPYFLSLLAHGYSELRQFDEAQQRITESTTGIQNSGERWNEAETCRLAGEVALKSPNADPTKAEACFHRALAIARQQQAKSWELRAAMSLARLWRDQGKVSEARELLAPVYGWFTEGCAVQVR